MPANAPVLNYTIKTHLPRCVPSSLMSANTGTPLHLGITLLRPPCPRTADPPTSWPLLGVKEWQSMSSTTLLTHPLAACGLCQSTLAGFKNSVHVFDASRPGRNYEKRSTYGRAAGRTQCRWGKRLGEGAGGREGQGILARERVGRWGSWRVDG